MEVSAPVPKSLLYNWILSLISFAPASVNVNKQISLGFTPASKRFTTRSATTNVFPAPATALIRYSPLSAIIAFSCISVKDNSLIDFTLCSFSIYLGAFLYPQIFLKSHLSHSSLVTSSSGKPTKKFWKIASYFMSTLVLSPAGFWVLSI